MLDFYFKNESQVISYKHTKSETPPKTAFHLHNRFEIYFFLSGNVNYLVEKKVYPLKYGDLLVMNNLEIHKAQIQPGKVYERITIHFSPEIAQVFSPEDYNLLSPFINRPKGLQNKVNLLPAQTGVILDQFHKIEALQNQDNKEFQILKLAYFVELLVLINRFFINTETIENYSSIPESFIKLLDYIDENLAGDLSLTTLGNIFYINSTYLSTLFKKYTGSNIGEYIRYKRISKAKKLITDGYTATEAALLSGFNDYSNFARAFKKTVGVSPGKFKTKEKIVQADYR